MRVLRPPCLSFMHRWRIVRVGWGEGTAIRVCGRCGVKEALPKEADRAE